MLMLFLFHPVALGEKGHRLCYQIITVTLTRFVDMLQFSSLIMRTSVRFHRNPKHHPDNTCIHFFLEADWVRISWSLDFEKAIGHVSVMEGGSRSSP